MPAILANASRFSQNSDYPEDKLIYLLNSSYTIGPGVDVTIPHGLAFTPLPMMQWSFNSDFSVSYESNTGPFPSGNPEYPFSLRVTVEANSTNIVIRGDGVIAPTTVYVRVFAFPPSDYTGDAPTTASQGDSFVHNSNYNYMKLIKSGIVSVASLGTSIIVHSLGVYPHVLAWTDDGTTISPIDLSYPLSGPNIEVTTSTLIMRNDSPLLPYDFHYRMYHNE